MWSLLKGTLLLRWPALIATAVVLAIGTAIVTVNGLLLDAGIGRGHDEVISLAAVFGGLTIMIMVTLVCVVFSLTLAQRAAEISLGRAVGVSPATVSFANTVVLWVVGSRREATTFGALGATPLLSGMVLLAELAIGVLSGLALGVVVALVAVLPFLAALREDLQLPHGTWALSGMVLGMALALAMLVGGAVLLLTVRRPLTTSLASD